MKQLPLVFYESPLLLSSSLEGLLWCVITDCPFALHVCVVMFKKKKLSKATQLKAGLTVLTLQRIDSLMFIINPGQHIVSDPVL